MIRIYLISLALIFLVSLTGTFLTLLYISPQEFPLLAQVLCFILLFTLAFSFFSLLGYFIRRVSTPTINKFISFNLSIRQGLLLGIFTCISAYFIHLQVFTWWAEALVLVILLLVELFFMLREDKAFSKKNS